MMLESTQFRFEIYRSVGINYDTKEGIMKIILRRRLYLFVFLFLLLSIFSTALGSEVSVFGPEQFMRTAGTPDIFFNTFSASSAEGKIIVRNGSRTGEDRIIDSISSAVVTLNGAQIFGPGDFKQQVYILEASVNLSGNNTLSVELASSPDSYLTIEILQEGMGPPAVTLNSDPDSILLGETSTLTWNTVNAETCLIDQGIGSVDPNGSIDVSPSETTVYTITATGPGGTASESVSVAVIQPPPTVSINATPDTITFGGSFTLSWDSTEALSCFIEPGIGDVETSGSIILSPIETTTYTITATGQGGTASSTTTVTVSYPVPVAKISANPETINSGEPSVLTWSSANATECSIEPDIGNVDLNGSISVNPAEITTYTLTASNPGGTATNSVTVSVTYLTPTASIFAEPEIINIGSPCTLTWNTSYASSVYIEPGIGSVNPSGSMSVFPTETTTYTVTASNPVEYVTANVTVAVIPLGISITSPLNNELISGSDVMIQGTIINPYGLEAGVSVNGIAALVDGDQFVANQVFLNEGENIITASATDVNGNTANDSITLYGETPENYIRFNIDSEIGIAPYESILNIESSFDLTETPYLTYTGPGVIDLINIPDQNGYNINISDEGLYFITVESEHEGIIYSDTIAVLVMTKEALDALLQNKWNDLKAALQNGDIGKALSFHSALERDNYERVYTLLGNNLQTRIQQMNEIEMILAEGKRAKYRVDRDHIMEGQTVTLTYYIYFIRSNNGLWLIERY